MKLTKNQIIEQLNENNIDYVKLQFVCFDSKLEEIEINIERLGELFSGSFSIDSRAIKNTKSTESEIFLIPDLKTFKIGSFGTSTLTARIICDLEIPNEEFSVNPRQTLKSIESTLKSRNMSAITKFDLDFMLLETDEEGSVYPADLNLRKEIIDEIKMSAKEMGIHINSIYDTNNEGQYNISIKGASPIESADNLLTLKTIIKEISSGYQIIATFMPKVFNDVSGNGMNIGIKLNQDGKDLFYNATTKKLISIECNRFIVGVIERIKEFTLITNSTINSYKRLNDRKGAPLTLTWSDSNTSSLIGVKSQKDKGSEVIVKNTDPLTNPYLALSMIIAAGLEGIKKKVQPIPASYENLFSKSIVELMSEGVEMLPQTLGMALIKFKTSEFVKGIMGEEQMRRYFFNQLKQHEKYEKITHDYELEEFLLK